MPELTLDLEKSLAIAASAEKAAGVRCIGALSAAALLLHAEKEPIDRGTAVVLARLVEACDDALLENLEKRS